MITEQITSINVFDDVDRMFLTIVLVVGITSLLYRIMGRFDKPMLLGGLLAGVIIANLHLPKMYFDLDSCEKLGDLGIVLFMMLVGAQFDYKILTEKKTNVLISAGGIILPFICGAFAATYLYRYNGGAQTSMPFFQFALLMGLSLAVSAFSLVSLFLSHSHLMHKKIAHVALLAAGTDDLFFWLVFGSIILRFQTNSIIRLNETILFSAYIFALIFIFPRLIRYVANRIHSGRKMLCFIICGCFISAVLADSVDLHQIFGGFIFGSLLPRDNPHILLIKTKLEDFVNIVFLPIFFAKIGAIANVNIITDSKVLVVGLGLAVLAFITKFTGTYISSRLLHHSRVESAFLGSLLNIRGIVEVVMMKVAWELGLITLSILTMFVVIAIVTTWMATGLALYFRRLLP